MVCSEAASAAKIPDAPPPITAILLGRISLLFLLVDMDRVERAEKSMEEVKDDENELRQNRPNDDDDETIPSNRTVNIRRLLKGDSRRRLLALFLVLLAVCFPAGILMLHEEIEKWMADKHRSVSGC